MTEIQVFDGFTGKRIASKPCFDGGGRMDCYSLFDGVTAMLIRLETHGFEDRRSPRDGLEINFCVSGRFESSFSPRDHAALTPGDMSVNRFDGVHGAQSESRFPLGYYEGVCLDVDCASAARWMAENVPPLATDFARLDENLLGGRWYFAGSAGPRCEHVFREFFENLPYAGREFLRLKTLELFMLLENVPRVEAAQEYCSAEQLRLIRHLRDHLLDNRSSYVSLAHLAKEHHISVTQLQKLFRQVYGMPVYHYVREYRLEQAAVELSSSDRRVVEIALNAGYDSASKFSEAFKKRYHVTPSAFRTAAIAAKKRNNITKTE